MSDMKKQNGTKDKSGEGRKNKSFYNAVIFSAIIAAALSFFFISITPGANGYSSTETIRKRKLAVKIGRLETEVNEKQNELINLLKMYGQKTGEPLPELKELGLSDEEKKIFEEKIINQGDISLKSLLRDILDKTNEISRLKIEIERFEVLLPKSHPVTGEETHFQIAMEFLINEKNVEKEKALRLVEETILFHPLLPGFRVWNFYPGDEYVTFVTQGSAPISPFELKKAPGKYPGDLSRAADEKERLEAEINKLSLTKDQLDVQIKGLRAEIQKMEKALNDLYDKNSEMTKLLNSLFYMVDLEENLLKRGIIKSRFLGLGAPKLKEISPEYFDQKIDLRKETVIKIHAKQFSLSKIKRVTLHPRFYKRGVDYKVKIEDDKQEAAIEILAVDKFRSEKIVISVE